MQLLDRVKDASFITEVEWDVVVFHDGCPDGITSAWVVRHAGKGDPELIGTRPGRVPALLEDDAAVQGRNVLVVDVSFDAESCDRLVGLANTFYVVDHHKTAAEELSEKDYLIYGGHDNRIAAASMVKALFLPKYADAHGSDLRYRFVDYVSDRDTWSWELENSHAVCEALYVNGHLKDIDALQAYWETSWSVDPAAALQVLVSQGQAYKKYGGMMAEQIGRHASIVWYKYDESSRFRIAVVNSCTMQSDVGNWVMTHQDEVAEGVARRTAWKELEEGEHPEVDYHFAVIWNASNPTTSSYCRFSVRSTKEGWTHPVTGARVTADMIARQYGGGGHVAAAGFSCPHNSFFWRTRDILPSRRPQRGFLSKLANRSMAAFALGAGAATLATFAWKRFTAPSE